MGWFSPLKGAYLTLGQVDKTLPVASDDLSTIKRGMVLTIQASADEKRPNGEWVLAGKDSEVFYVALQDYTDPTAAFAGTGFSPTEGGVPAITGLDLGQDGEYETSVYDTAATYVVGDKLTVVDGLLTKAGDGDAVVGFVTTAPAKRWINNAIATPVGQKDQRLATRTGATETVLHFRTR